MRALLLVPLLLIAGPVPATADTLPSNAWSRVAGPSHGATRAIGSYVHGCLAGGIALPIDGPGYEAIRLERHRFFGHAETIAYLRRLGERAVAAGLPRFRVGDVAQARGGPLPYGHKSHANGLDADIWLTFETSRGTVPGDRDFPEMGSMLDADRQIDPARFGPDQVKLLQLAASDDRVERIFVNPAIKLALCRGYGGATAEGTAWLHRLRPWWGHDDHFHVRLRCPADSQACEAQPPVESGDGCDADLEDWGRPAKIPVEPPAEPPATPKPAPARTPPACAIVLRAR
jgi:penicillin-insensitive murein DD-endopeptidase